jgi:hypothetical protein
VVSSGVCALAAATLWARQVTLVPRVQFAMVALVALFALAAVRGLDGSYA